MHQRSTLTHPSSFSSCFSTWIYILPRWRSLTHHFLYHKISHIVSFVKLQRTGYFPSLWGQSRNTSLVI